MEIVNAVSSAARSQGEPIELEESPLLSMPSITPLSQSTTNGAAVLSLYHNEDLQMALELGEKLAKDVHHALELLPPKCVHPTILTSALDLSHRPKPSTRIVGVVGRMGEGKSSLINSLLDTEDLAVTRSSGIVGTTFVTEYRQKRDSENVPYLFSCTRLIGAELRQELEQLLEDYNCGQPAQMSRLHQVEKPSGDLSKDIKAKADAAQAVFETAFAGAPSFNLSLLDYGDAPELKLQSLQYLMGWADSVQWPSVAGEASTWTVEADTSDSLNELTEDLRDRGLWPLLKQVCVYLDSPLLKDGLVLADIPGYHDVNPAREQAAKRYESSCRDLIVVADIARSVDNPIIRDVVQGYRATPQDIGLPCSKNVIVVCTKSGEGLTEKVHGKLVDRNTLRIINLKLQVAEMRNDLLGFNAAAQQHKILLMKARNKIISQRLQKTYSSSYSASASLPSFA